MSFRMVLKSGREDGGPHDNLAVSGGDISDVYSTFYNALWDQLEEEHHKKKEMAKKGKAPDSERVKESDGKAKNKDTGEARRQGSNDQAASFLMQMD